MTASVGCPNKLVDREAETDLLGCVFVALLALDAHPNHEAASRVLDDFATFDVTWICSSDLARVALAMQAAQRAVGVPVPLAVRDVLRARHQLDELRCALPMLVARSAAVVAGWPYYVRRVGEVCARRREYLAHVDAAAELLTDAAQR